MATIVTLIMYGGENRHFALAEPFSSDLVNRFMGFLVLKECGDQIKALKRDDPGEFDLLMSYATSGNWFKFVQYVNDALEGPFIYYEQVDLTDVPSAQKTVDLAREFLR